jgi:hypothetical protein
MFKTSIVLPDAGLQEREHEDVSEMMRYLVACVGMDASPSTLRVTHGDKDLSAFFQTKLRQNLRVW